MTLNISSEGISADTLKHALAYTGYKYHISSYITLIQTFVSRYILKGKRCKIDTDCNRPDIDMYTDSDTAWPAVRGTLNHIINFTSPPSPPPFYLLTPLLTLFFERLTSSS